MGRLAAEGLITMRPRRRAEVRSLTPQELIDAYQVREALEVMAVRLLIPRVTEAHLARLEELIDRMAAHSAEGAVREFFTANVSFHELLCELQRQPEAAGGAPPARRRDRPVPEPHAGAARQHERLEDRAPRDPGCDRLRDADRAAALTAGPISGCPRSGSRRRWMTTRRRVRRESRRSGVPRVRRPRGSGDARGSGVPAVGGAGFEVAGGAVTRLTSRLRGRARSWPCPISARRCVSTVISSG